MAAFLAYCYEWDKFCPFMLSSFYVLTITLFMDYLLLMLHAFMHAHILKAFYALWHIIVWFAGGAESRRAELYMFLESACSVSHTSISQRYRRARWSCTVASWLQLSCQYSVSFFRSDWFLVKQSTDFCYRVIHLLRRIQPSGWFVLTALCEACNGSLALRIGWMLSTVAEKPKTKS